MKLSSFFVGSFFAVAVIAVLLLVFGVKFERPVAVQGAALYNPANEMVLTGVVQGVEEFACPVSEGEMGSHLLLKTANQVMQIHLIPARIMRSQNLRFAVGEEITVAGSKLRFHGRDDLIAREITRGNETFVLRDYNGRPLMVQ